MVLRLEDPEGNSRGIRCLTKTTRRRKPFCKSTFPGFHESAKPSFIPLQGDKALTFPDVSPENLQPDSRTDAWNLLKNLTGMIEPEAKSRMRGFSLNLADGSRWWIAGSLEASFLPEKMAAIMQLKEGENLEDGHLLFFFDKNGNGPHPEIPRLQGEGWIDAHPYSIHICFHPQLRHLLAESDDSPYLLMCLVSAAIFWESVCRGGLPFHAALLEHQGQGVILAGRGNMGKTTCASRVPPPWRARCDDEVLTVLSPEGRYLAQPFPTWSDYYTGRAENTWKVEDTLPLAGIFFIEQAPEDHCLPLWGYQAALAATYSAEQPMKRIIRGCDPALVREIRLKMFANACEIVKRIPAFHLQVSLNGRFWEKIEAALGWR
jgi:SynChlorMet cassette protein ScmC